MAFSHMDEGGNAVMVDVGEKDASRREAVATGRIVMSEDCFIEVREGRAKKGDVLAVAQVAGIMATKRTAELIPLCHPLQITKATVEFDLHEEKREIQATCTVRCEGKTGVEMEALTGVSVALLTVYDMCKAMDKAMVMGDIHLLGKSGGKSGRYLHAGEGREHD